MHCSSSHVKTFSNYKILYIHKKSIQEEFYYYTISLFDYSTTRETSPED